LKEDFMKKLIVTALVAAMLGGCATTKDGSGGPTVNAIDWASVLDGARGVAAGFCSVKPTLNTIAEMAIALAAAKGKKIGQSGADDKVFANQAADLFCQSIAPAPAPGAPQLGLLSVPLTMDAPKPLATTVDGKTAYYGMVQIGAKQIPLLADAQ
jgi:hypothetical protein